MVRPMFRLEALRGANSALKRTSQVDVEVRPIKTLHHSDSSVILRNPFFVCLALLQLLIKVFAVVTIGLLNRLDFFTSALLSAKGSAGFDISLLQSRFAAVFSIFRSSCGAIEASHLGNTEDGF